MTAPSPLLAASTGQLAAALAKHKIAEWREVKPERYGRFCSCGVMLDAQDIDGSFREHQADALLADRAVVPAASLADDETLVEQVADGVLYEVAEGGTREIAQAVLRALAAALEDR